MRKMKNFGRNTKRLGKDLSVGVTAPLAIMGATAVQAFRVQAKAIAQVESGLQSTGNQVGYTSKELQAMASSLQGKTLFGDEDILQNATAQLLTFTNISGDQFARTQQAALDLATRLDGDLKGASIQLGKALNDPVANLSALSRSGIQFSEEQKAVIKSMAESGRLADAQTLILDELNKQYGGSAEAAAKADGGITQLANAFGDLQEQFGAILVDVLRPVIDWASDMISRFQQLNPAFKRMIVIGSLIAGALGPLLVMLPTILSAFGAIGGALASIGAVLTGPVIAGIAAVAAAGVLLYQYWDEVVAYFTEGEGATFMAIVYDHINTYIGFIIQYFTFLWQSIKAIWDFIAPYIVDVLTKAFNVVQRIFAKLFNAIDTLFSSFSDLFQGNWGSFAKKISNVFIDAIQALLLGLNFGIGSMLKLVDKGLRLLGMDSGLADGFAGVIDGMVEGLEGLRFEFAKTKGESRDFLKEISDFAGGMFTGGGGPSMPTAPADNAAATAAEQVDPVFAEIEDTDPAEVFADEEAYLSNWAQGVEKAKEANERFNQSVQQMAGSLQGQFSNLFSGLMNGTQSFGEFMRKTLTDLLIQLASMAAAFAVISILLPGSSIAKGGLGAFLQGGFNIPTFANGGIVSGPTLGLMGEYGGAATNPEVIAPLDKLQGMMGGGQNVTVTGRIDGTDILLTSERSDIYRNRIRGY